MSSAICPEEHEPRTDAKRARREGLVDVGMPLPEFPSNLFDMAHPSPTYAADRHKNMQPHSSFGQQLSDTTVVPPAPRHAPRPPSSDSSRRPEVRALAAPIDAPLSHPHQAGQKRRREDETLSQPSYSDAESVACTDAGHVGEEGPIDLGLKLAEFPSDLLVMLAQTLGNPLALLVAKAHLSKAFCEAARAAQGLLTQVDLSKWHLVTDETVVAVASRCKQLTTLDLSSCRNITDAAVVAVASGCKQLTTLGLTDCCLITDAAVVAVASGCKQLKTLGLSSCRNLTDAAVVAVASGCKQLTTLGLSSCRNITDAAVVAVASGCKQLTTLDLSYGDNLTDAAVVAVASGCKQLTTLNLFRCRNITDVAVRAVVTGSAGKQLTSDEMQWLRMQRCNSAWVTALR